MGCLHSLPTKVNRGGRSDSVSPSEGSETESRGGTRPKTAKPIRARSYAISTAAPVSPSGLPDIDLSRFKFADSPSSDVVPPSPTHDGSSRSVVYRATLCVACGHNHENATRDAARTDACDVSDKYHLTTVDFAGSDQDERSFHPTFFPAAQS